MPTPAPAHLPPAAPDLTPAPAVLHALAHVNEVDLLQGLGRQRLAELIHEPVRPARSGRGWLVAGAVLVAAAVAAALVLAFT